MADVNVSWIKLYYELFDRPKWAEYEATLLEGRRTRAQRRAAMDFALSSVIRLYLALGKTEFGCIDYTKLGERLQLERWMTMEGEELLETLDRMAECSIIDRFHWTERNVITTSNAAEQAEARKHRKRNSERANAAKAKKSSGGGRRTESESRDGEPLR